MVNSTLFSIIVFIGLCLSFTAHASVTRLDASIDRNPVMEREPFVLKIEANGSVNTNDLDLSILNKTTFRVGRTATGSQTQLINGSLSRSTTWSIQLVADSAGKHIIPPFELNGVKSKPITVTVVKVSQQNTGPNESIYITNQLQGQKVYVQQSIKLITKLHISPQVELQSGRLSEPSLEDAIIKQHGKDKDTTEIINGIRYRVIERVYTITPQSSGSFTILSPQFNGDVTSRNGRRSSFSSFIQSKPVAAQGKNFEIEVLPIPVDYQGPWLPSDLVQLNEEWQPATDTVEVGEPITRTYTLTALNVSEEQLPEIKSVYPAEFSVYPDKSETHSVVRNNALVSQRVSSEAIVANKPGTYTLPEITVNWFNAKIRKAQKATLPSRTITVVPSSNPQGIPQSGIPAMSSQSSQVMNNDCACADRTESVTKPVQSGPTGASSSLKDVTSLTIGETKVSSFVIWTLMAIGWLGFITFGLLYLKNKQRGLNQATTQQHDGGARSLATHGFDINELKRACLSHQPNQAHALLVEWAKTYKPNARSFSHFQQMISNELKAEITRLEQFKYSDSHSLKTPGWQGEKLWQAIEAQLKTVDLEKTESSDLPPLNPS